MSLIFFFFFSLREVSSSIISSPLLFLSWFLVSHEPTFTSIQPLRLVPFFTLMSTSVPSLIFREISGTILKYKVHTIYRTPRKTRTRTVLVKIVLVKIINIVQRREFVIK